MDFAIALETSAECVCIHACCLFCICAFEDLSEDHGIAGNSALSLCGWSSPVFVAAIATVVN